VYRELCFLNQRLEIVLRESKVEKRLVDRVGRAGGKALKLGGPNDRGKPDRLVLMPGGVVLFCELKAPGKKLSKLQAHWFSLLGTLGFRCELVDSYERVDQLIEELG